MTWGSKPAILPEKGRTRGYQPRDSVFFFFRFPPVAHGYWNGSQPYGPAKYNPGDREGGSDEPPPEYDVDLEMDVAREEP